MELHSKLWSVQTKEDELGIADMDEFSVQSYGNMCKLLWKSDVATVTVTLHAECEKIYWGFNVDLYGGDAVDKVEFPIIE